MTYWNNIYSNFNPVAFDLGFISIHWYGIMYALALLTALMAGKWIAKRDKLPITNKLLDNYFIWVEIGVIVGARVGYILFYDTHTAYYLTHPWQMFNPFMNGIFVGIRGMSYHGAIIGFLLATFAFKYRHKKTDIWGLLDLVALSVPVGYIFGRIGNFMNQELIGRPTELSWGVYIDGALRHPSQLYEAFLEGVVVFFILYIYRTKKRFSGELIALYGVLYSLARFIAEFWREPDFQMGYMYGGWMTMGQALSLLMILVSIILYVYLNMRVKKK
ncbi:MAG: prolipoprotein diacylglyceryl transferase [Sulfurospirillum sp.]|nr:prolipoprotein diacylglyceryl transferase [Sulfurospirillum sp.]MBL0703451.1 prolipoprotein diacylglyceryl transferase [Sulfurospirillum sp.]